MAGVARKTTDEKHKITLPAGGGNNDNEEQSASLDSSVISLSEFENSLDSTTDLLVLGKKRKNRDLIPGELEYCQMKRRKLRVPGAPKMPLAGYVRYMNDRREALRKERPEKTARERSKIICEEWANLRELEKRPYLRAAALDKQRYLSELHTFLREHPDVYASEMARSNAQGVLKEKDQHNGEEKNKSNKSKETSSAPPSPSQHNCGPTPTVSEPKTSKMSIYTREFLEYSRLCNMDLRMMRQTKAELEQQRAVLEKHVENLGLFVEKMTVENDEYEEKTRLMGIYTQKFKAKLVHAFAGLAIPSFSHGATMKNIEKYMAELHKMANSNTHGPASLNKAKDILRKLDLEIQI